MSKHLAPYGEKNIKEIKCPKGFLHNDTDHKDRVHATKLFPDKDIYINDDLLKEHIKEDLSEAKKLFKNI